MQIDALTAVGCEKTFSDKASGTKIERSGLTEALTYARDCLVVWKLDRLGRSMKGLVELAATLESRKVDLRSLTDGVDTTTPGGRFFFNIMASFAEMERELMLERTNAGLAAAKRAGRVGGRKLVMTPTKLDAARKLLDAGTPPKDVANSVGVSVATLYRHLPARTRE
jgi:DNA invertase Pin-like site-specific DNA recombinase